MIVQVAQRDDDDILVLDSGIFPGSGTRSRFGRLLTLQLSFKVR